MEVAVEVAPPAAAAVVQLRKVLLQAVLAEAVQLPKVRLQPAVDAEERAAPRLRVVAVVRLLKQVLAEVAQLLKAVPVAVAAVAADVVARQRLRLWRVKSGKVCS